MEMAQTRGNLFLKLQKYMNYCFRTVTDIQLVDLFSPEFNLKIGDLFSKNASEMNPPLECAKEMSESEGFGSKLECIVSECLDRDNLQ